MHNHQAIVVVALFCGCVTTSSYTGREEAVIRVDELRDRAAFELGCPTASLEVAPIGMTTAGVTGCAKRAVYAWSGYSWIANTGRWNDAAPTPDGALGPTATEVKGGRSPLSRGQSADPSKPCTTADREDMKKAGVSETAIQSTCGP